MPEQIELDLVAKIETTLTNLTSLKNGMTGVQTAANKAGSAVQFAFKKSSEDAKKFYDTLRTGSGSVAEIGTRLRTIPTEIAKAEPAVKSLRAQLKAAREEAFLMQEQFGENSPQAISAQKNLANLQDKVSDLSARTAALNPEAKFTAFAQLGRGIVGAFSAGAGAMAIFGIKSESAERTIARLQGILVFSQGINELLQLGESFGNLKAVISAALIPTTAQTVALETQAVAAGEATVANTAVAASATATGGGMTIAAVATNIFNLALKTLLGPVGLVIAAVAIAVQLFEAFSGASEDAAESQAKFAEEARKNEERLGNIASTVTKGYIENNNFRFSAEKEFAIKSAKNAEELDAKLKSIELERAKSTRNLVLSQLRTGFELNSDLKSQFDEANRIIEQAKIDEIRERDEKNKEIVEKNKKFHDELKNSQKELEAALKDLRSKSQQALGEGQGGFSRIEIQRDLALQEVDIIKQGLEDKIRAEKQAEENIAAFKQGRRAKEIKDVQLTNEQINQLAILKQSVELKFQKDVEALEAEHQKTMLDLITDGGEKQLKQFELDFAERKKKYIEAGATEEQIERLHQQELLKIQTQQAINAVNLQASIDESIIEQRKRGNESEKEFEKQKALDILKVKLDAAQKNATILKKKFDEDSSKENKDALEAAKAQVEKLKNGVEQATSELNTTKKFSLAKLLGITGKISAEDEAKLNEAAASLAQNLQSILTNAIAAEQAVNDQKIADNDKLISSLEERIQATEDAINKEIELQNKGYANNVDGKRKELAQLKAEREKALQNEKALQEQKRKLAKEQAAIEVAQQVATLATAAVNIIAGWSSVPFVGVVLGLSAVAALVAGFLSIKQKINAATALEYGGWIGGKRHSQGGSKYYATDGSGYELEEGEFVSNRKSSRKYGKILEAMNKDDMKALRDIDLVPLLKGTGVRVNKEATKRINDNATIINSIHFNNQDSRLGKVEGTLGEIHEFLQAAGKKMFSDNSRSRTVQR